MVHPRLKMVASVSGSGGFRRRPYPFVNFPHPLSLSELNVVFVLLLRFPSATPQATSPPSAAFSLSFSSYHTASFAASQAFRPSHWSLLPFPSPLACTAPASLHGSGNDGGCRRHLHGAAGMARLPRAHAPALRRQLHQVHQGASPFISLHSSQSPSWV
jgi:hypothetical protein